VEIPVPAERAAEIPGEAILAEIPEVEFPAQVVATSPVLAMVIPGEILGLASPAEAFPVMNVAEEVDFVRESRTVVSHKVAYRLVLGPWGGATVEAGH